MRRGIFIPLLEEQCEELFDIADRQWRRPVDQAAKILIEGLRRERMALESKTVPIWTAAPKKQPSGD